MQTETQSQIAMRFLKQLNEVHENILVTDLEAATLSLEKGISTALSLIEKTAARGNQIIFIGNGGSAAIASHQAVDYWKNGSTKAVCFNDSSLLTCIGNDFVGVINAFRRPKK